MLRNLPRRRGVAHIAQGCELRHASTCNLDVLLPQVVTRPVIGCH